jgi:YVTN family beta-propeller protein
MVRFLRALRPLSPLVIALGALAGCGSGQAVDEYVYVSNEDSNDLSVISAQTGEVIATIAVGTRPRGVKASPDGRTVYVALSGSPKCPPTMPDEECAKLVADKSQDGIAEIDASTRKITRVLPGGSDPEQFDVSWSREKLFVSEGVRLAPDGKHFYVTGETDHDVTVIDAETGEVKAKVSVGQRPRDVVFLSDGSRAYVSSELGGTVSAIDTASYEVLATITLGEGAKPMGLAVSPDDRLLYVATGRGRKVFQVEVATERVLGSVEVGDRPWGIALSSDAKHLYTANGPSGDVTIVEGVAVGPAPAPR